MTIISTHGLASCEVDWELSRLGYDGFPRLGKGEVHLWVMDLEQSIKGESMRNFGQLEETYLPWLSLGESKKYTQLPVDQKSHYLNGRIVLRILLGSYLDKSPQDISLDFGDFGKPALIDCDGNPCFNYSDTKDLLIYAVGDSGELGVDAEYLSRKIDYRRILQRKFSLAEALEVEGTVESFSREAITQRFLAAWTRKESYGKAIGVGINFNMKEVEVATNLGLASISFTVDGKSWWLTQLLFDEYVISITTSIFKKIRCFRLSNHFEVAS